MTSIVQAQRVELDRVVREPARPQPSKGPGRRRPVAVFVLACATATVVAVIGLTPGQGPGRTEAATALRRLAVVAGHRALPGRGDIAHTVSVGQTWAYGVDARGHETATAEQFTRELWIAPDGSGRVKQVRAGLSADGRFTAANGGYRKLADWPNDTAGVLAKLRAEAAETDMRPIDAEAFVGAGDHLRDAYVPAELRAAIFEAVARLDGVRALGTVTDHNGRAGVGFEIDSDSSHDSRWELIFDPATSQLLGEREGSISKGYSSWTVYTVSEMVPTIPPGGAAAVVPPG